MRTFRSTLLNKKKKKMIIFFVDFLHNHNDLKSIHAHNPRSLQTRLQLQVTKGIKSSLNRKKWQNSQNYFDYDIIFISVTRSIRANFFRWNLSQKKKTNILIFQTQKPFTKSFSLIRIPFEVFSFTFAFIPTQLMWANSVCVWCSFGIREYTGVRR